MRYLFIMCALISIMTLSGSLFGQKPMGDGEGIERKNNGDRRLSKFLNLSQEQIAQMRNINKKTKFAMQEAHLQFMKSRTELDEAIYAETADEETIKTRLQAVVEAQEKITRVQAMREFAVRKVLTSEQLVKFREMRKMHSKRRIKGTGIGERPKRGGRGNPGNDRPRPRP